MKFLVCLFLSLAPVLEAEIITVDFTREVGVFRPLNGVNKGPLGPGGLLDLTADFSRLRIPYVRLHDCHWPNPDVVDMHVVFPDARADPSRESHYDFALTDEYLQAIRAAGSGIIYRLGESIEHTRAKRFVHPPADPEKWAQVCLGIIRHYNHGWANGHHFGIRYWEIWNEPENRPAMWTGSDEQYLNLYATTSRAIHRNFPELKVGGPATGNAGSIMNGIFTPSAFLVRFLEFCRAEDLPLNFLSWHCYTTDPDELVVRARGVRKVLDDYGFKSTESHLNEWNYLPDNSWKPVMREASAQEREAYYHRMGGAEGASFIAAAYLRLQDAPLDMANFFHGEIGAFGLFNEFGVPNRAYDTFAAIAELSDGKRVQSGSSKTIAVQSSLNQNKGAILMSNPNKEPVEVELNLTLPSSNRWTAISHRVTDKKAGPERIELKENKAKLTIAPQSVLLLKITGE